MNRTAKARFEAKTMPVPEAGCWLWTGAGDPGGYGHFWDGERYISAHRFAWVLEYGEPPSGQCVLHRCDTKLCVNPGHLFLGTNAENTADMFRKGRQNTQRGERTGRARLTVEQVIEARQLYAAGGCTFADLQARYGVCNASIFRAVRGESWSHIPGAVAA